MRAMVLAAGLGTRLRPLTHDRPKALVEVAGRTMLEITLERLRDFGVSEVIVNAHHYADMLIDYLRAHDGFGMRVEISREDELLDTGGGLKKAGWFFTEPGSDEPFLVHNVDVLSDIDLAELVRIHSERGALATLAVQDRVTSRYLLFDKRGELCGRKSGREGEPELARECSEMQALAFAGIHVMSPRLPRMLTEHGAFSIISAYMRLAGEGERICAFRADAYRWRDLGRPEQVSEATREISAGLFPTAH